MAKTFHCTIVTPTESVFDGDLVYASIPAWDGQLGVMPGQSPLLASLGFGSLRVTAPEGGDRWFLLEGGFAQIDNNNLTLLTERAIPAEKLSLREAEAELAEASARVTQPGTADRASVERDQKRAMAKVALARTIGARGGAI